VRGTFTRKALTLAQLAVSAWIMRLTVRRSGGDRHHVRARWSCLLGISGADAVAQDRRMAAVAGLRI
jgi:hypothetical protein